MPGEFPPLSLGKLEQIPDNSWSINNTFLKIDVH